MKGAVYSNIVFYSAIAAGLAVIIVGIGIFLFWGETPDPEEEIQRILADDAHETSCPSCRYGECQDCTLDEILEHLKRTEKE